MGNLTIEEYREKIERVKQDIDQLRNSGTSGRRLDVLCEYQKYLEEELVFLINEKNRAA